MTKMTSSQPKFLAVDFFCGAGGTTRGLIDAGGFVICGIDNDPTCEKTYTYNNVNHSLDKSASRYLCMDIHEASAQTPDGQKEQIIREIDGLITKYRLKSDVPLLFSICAPCQPFTKLTQITMSEERLKKREVDSTLLSQAVDIVRLFMPDLVLLENVRNISSSRFGGVWASVQEELRDLGYNTSWKQVDAANFGIPQRRIRAIMVAVRGDKVKTSSLDSINGEELLMPEHDKHSKKVTVKQAIGHLPKLKAGQKHPTIPNHQTRSLKLINYERLKEARPGENNSYMERLGKKYVLDCHKNYFERRQNGMRAFADTYTRMDGNKVAPTMTTACVSVSNGRFGHYDPRQVRGISVREAAILQSFPENYIFFPEEHVGPGAKMVGNAVPPKLAKFYAEYLVDCILLPALPIASGG